MLRCYLLVFLLLCLVPPAMGEPAPLPLGSAALLCRPAIMAAERAHGVPHGLMAAIGRVESGRRDPVSGASNPWPWTVNAEGQGSFYDTKAQAVGAVRSMQARGIRSIDVGCMQVNLMHHPQAFASLEQAFDPAANARYASRFLTELFERTGAWPIAAEHYHSATPDLGADYGRKVMAVWPEEKRRNDGARLTLAYGWATALMEGGPGVSGGLLPPSHMAFPGVRPRRSEGGDAGLLRPSHRPAHMTMAFYRAPGEE